MQEPVPSQLTQNVLEIADLNQFYGESHILRELTLTVPTGSCTCIMGRNGVGKTTLMKVIMGLLSARSGRISFEGLPLLGQSAHRRAQLGIGYVPQGREIFPKLSVAENLQTGLGAAAARGHGIPEEIYELFPVLHKMQERRGGDLSGGQQQQLAIARALVLRPRLLILDEPTEGIQPNIVREIGDIIIRLNREHGLTVLLVEQKLGFARHAASHFHVLERGAVVASGGIDELTDTVVQTYLSV
jgi:urea transport system ATP-binding protein